MAKTYFCRKEYNWGDPRYVVWAEGNSIFGYYTTKKAAIADCKTFGIRLTFLD